MFEFLLTPTGSNCVQPPIRNRQWVLMRRFQNDHTGTVRLLRMAVLDADLVL